MRAAGTWSVSSSGGRGAFMKNTCMFTVSIDDDDDDDDDDDNDDDSEVYRHFGIVE